MSADDIKLLPCPFCGGSAHLEEHPPHQHVIIDMPYHAGSATVECGGCEAGMIAETAGAVADAWNRRAPSLQGDETDDWIEFGKRFAIDLSNTRAAAEMVHKGAGTGPYEALLVGIELLAQHARLAMRERIDADRSTPAKGGE